MRGPGEFIRAFTEGGMPAGLFIGGRVCDVEGRPVAARVGARCMLTGRMSEARADDCGEFALAVGPGHHEIAAVAPGHGDAFRRGVFPPAHLDLVLTPPLRLAGRTLAAGDAPVAGVVLRLRKGQESTDRGAWVLDDFAACEATSGPDGSFAMPVSSALDGVLALEVAGGPVRRGALVSLPAATGTADLVVPVEPARPGGVLGQVRDLATGSPLVGVTVRRGAAAGRTDAQGTFRLDRVLPGRGPVSVAVPHRPPFREVVDVERGSKILLRVPSACDLEGTVLDPSGAPVPGAHVCWTGAALHSRGRCDDAGRFRILGIAPERGGIVQAWADGFVPAEGWPPPDQARVLVRLQRGGRLRGRVVDSGGGPVPGVPVHLAPAGRNERAPRVIQDVRATRSGDDGGYAFEDLPPGDVWVFAASRSSGVAPAYQRATVQAGAECAAPDLRLDHGEDLRGVVTDPDGFRVARALVHLVSPLRSALARADREGRFTLPPAAPWNEVLAAVAPGFSPVSMLVRADEPPPRVVLPPLPDRESLTA